MTEVTCHWLAPVRIGDTVRVELTFTAAQLTPQRHARAA